MLAIEERIAGIERLVVALKSIRKDIIQILQWEICKNNSDAVAEFDRTMLFIEASINALRDFDLIDGQFKTIGGIQAKIRRAAVGVLLALGPFNYPVSVHIFNIQVILIQVNY